MKEEDIHIAQTIDAVAYYLKTADLSHIVFDVETRGLKVGSPLLGISLYDGKNFPLFVCVDGVIPGVPLDELRPLFAKYFPQPDVYGIGHNCKFDAMQFQAHGLEHPPICFDTLVAAHLINSEQRLQLEIRVKEDLDVTKKTFAEITGVKWERINWSDPDLVEKLAVYSCEDAYYTYKLYELYKEDLKKDGLEDLFYRVEIPLINTLVAMALRGVRINKGKLERMGMAIDAEMEELEFDIFDVSGSRFNINSSQQKAVVLYDQLGLPCLKTTPKGGRSTDSQTLEMLAEKGYTIAKMLVGYSELNKLQTGYVRAIPQILYPDGKLRAEFNSSGTATGRFSSSNPNLQNQPNNDKFPVRGAFIPSAGYKFAICDYSQIELRVMAHASKDAKMVEVFLAGGDIHGEVARALGISRKSAKVVNFGILYGMGKRKLAAMLGISEGEAGSIINNYHTVYHGYSYWSKKVEEFAQHNGYVRTMFGRIRRLPDATRGSSDMYFAAMRQGVNTMIQGAAADLIKVAMVRLYERFVEKRIDAHILLQVHDELVTEVAEAKSGRYYYMEEVGDIIREVMETSVKLIVPTPIDLKLVNNWAQMKDDSFLTLDRRMKKIEFPHYLFI